jgi:outer membrane protein assembly factor BamB
MQLENRCVLYDALANRDVLACFAGDWHLDAQFRCPGEPFWTIITVGPMENVHAMPPGYRIVEVRGRELRHTYRLLHGLAEVHPVRPSNGSRVFGPLELIVTEHVPSDRTAAPAYSEDGFAWTAMARQPFPGNRTAGCHVRWARWRTKVDVRGDATLMIRAARDSPPTQYAEISVRVVATPVRWRRTIDQDGEPSWRSQPVIAGGLVVLGDNRGVHAFDSESGELAWTFAETRRWLGTPLSMDGAVVATSWESDIVSLDLQTGRLRWRRRQACAIPPSQPCAAGDLVVVGGMKRGGIWDGSFSALDATTGDIRWSLRYDHPFFATPLFEGRRLWTACGDVVRCLEASTGRCIWVYHPEHFSLYGPMVQARGLLFAPDIDGWTYVLDPDSGREANQFLAPRGTGFSSDGECIYAACGVRGLRAYEPDSCRELWRVQREGSYFSGLPVPRREVLLAPCTDGNLYMVEKVNGRVGWSFQFGDIGATRVACDLHQGYLTTGDGALIAFTLPPEARG